MWLDNIQSRILGLSHVVGQYPEQDSWLSHVVGQYPEQDSCVESCGWTISRAWFLGWVMWLDNIQYRLLGWVMWLDNIQSRILVLSHDWTISRAGFLVWVMWLDNIQSRILGLSHVVGQYPEQDSWVESCGWTISRAGFLGWVMWLDNIQSRTLGLIHVVGHYPAKDSWVESCGWTISREGFFGWVMIWLSSCVLDRLLWLVLIKSKNRWKKSVLKPKTVFVPLYCRPPHNTCALCEIWYSQNYILCYLIGLLFKHISNRLLLPIFHLLVWQFFFSRIWKEGRLENFLRPIPSQKVPPGAFGRPFKPLTLQILWQLG
jgi:hypothetical protein